MQEMCQARPLVHWLGVQGKLGCAFGHKLEEAGPLQGLRRTRGAEGGHRKTEKCQVSTAAAQVLICIRLFETPWTVAPQAPLSMGFSRQEHWSGLPVPSPGGLPDPGTERASPALKADSFLLSHLGAPISSTQVLHSTS